MVQRELLQKGILSHQTTDWEVAKACFAHFSAIEFILRSILTKITSMEDGMTKQELSKWHQEDLHSFLSFFKLRMMSWESL